MQRLHFGRTGGARASAASRPRARASTAADAGPGAGAPSISSAATQLQHARPRRRRCDRQLRPGPASTARRGPRSADRTPAQDRRPAPGSATDPAARSPRGTRASAASRSRSSRPVGDAPKTCSPSRICASLRSQRKVSILRSASALVGRQADVRSSRASRVKSRMRLRRCAQPPPVHAAGRVVLVEQRLEILQRAVGLGPRQRRHQMIDDDRAGAALGLRALAGIVDDERIEMRQLAPQHRRIGRCVERRRLARQPLQRPVLAVVDDRMRPELVPHPEIGGEIGVRRHEVRIVIGRGLVAIIAARRLQQRRRRCRTSAPADGTPLHARTDQPRARPSAR